MISNTAEYALRAVLHLARQPDVAETAQQIAAATKVPPGYMSKVLQDLAKAGVVLSQRGPRGGFTLARPPEATSVLDVINAVDPMKRIRSCPLGLPEHGKKLCALHQRLDDAMAYVEQVFADSTMADLLKPGRSAGRCVFPTVNGAAQRQRQAAPPATRSRRR